MGRTKKPKIKELKPEIKIQLDHKTIITLKDMKKFDFWKEKYPKAMVIN
jgi:hypothetical protein